MILIDVNLNLLSFITLLILFFIIIILSFKNKGINKKIKKINNHSFVESVTNFPIYHNFERL